LFIASLCWYITYISVPHFFAQIAEIGTSEVADYDPAVGVLMLVDLHNTGVPSPIKNWKLFLTFPSGEKAMTDWRVKRILLARKTHKEMVITPPYDHDLEEQAGNTAVGQTWVHGNISFVFFGYRDQAVDVPGSIFKLTFEDKLGQVYSARCKLTGRKRMAITPQAFLPSEDRKESEGALTGSETRDLKPKSPYHSRTANLVLSA
jgi:hypothetical protein